MATAKAPNLSPARQGALPNGSLLPGEDKFCICEASSSVNEDIVKHAQGIAARFCVPALRAAGVLGGGAPCKKAAKPLSPPISNGTYQGASAPWWSVRVSGGQGPRSHPGSAKQGPAYSPRGERRAATRGETSPHKKGGLPGLLFYVEMGGLEPPSKQSTNKLSTRLSSL